LIKFSNAGAILLDEAFVDTDGVLKWCSTPKVAVPVPLESGDLSQPFVLITKPGPAPLLKAVPLDKDLVPDILCQIPDLFFEKNC